MMNLVGQRFGRLIVIEETTRPHGSRRWLCRCDCGAEKVIIQPSLRSGNTRSCGCLGLERLKQGADAKFQDLTGERFGRLVVASYQAKRGGRGSWRCRCDCGAIHHVRPDCLLAGTTKSCGCLSSDRAREVHLTHGHTEGQHKSREYQSWSNMISRVDARKGRHFLYYGIRGITVCERWRTFENFLADMGTRPPETSLDRINNDGHYEPGNCRWATRKQQISNRRTRAQCAAERAHVLALLKKESSKNAA